MTNIEKIENLYNNIDYIINGTEEGWLDLKDDKLLHLCYSIKILSEHTYNELFKFKDKGVLIKLK